MTKLEQFIHTYNYYIHKLLWSNVDDFLAHKRQKYQEKCESNRLNKFANVFNRLKFDVKERKKNDEEIKRELTMKYQDPFASPSRSPDRKRHSNLGSLQFRLEGRSSRASSEDGVIKEMFSSSPSKPETITHTGNFTRAAT